MTVWLSVLLLVNAVFNVVVWPIFFRRITRDPRARESAGKPTRFLIVHAVIIGLALLLAVVSAMAAVVALVVP